MKKRDFIKKTVLGAAAASLAPISTLKALEATKKISEFKAETFALSLPITSYFCPTYINLSKSMKLEVHVWPNVKLTDKEREDINKLQSFWVLIRKNGKIYQTTTRILYDDGICKIDKLVETTYDPKVPQDGLLYFKWNDDKSFVFQPTLIVTVPSNFYINPEKVVDNKIISNFLKILVYEA